LLYAALKTEEISAFKKPLRALTPFWSFFCVTRIGFGEEPGESALKLLFKKALRQNGGCGFHAVFGVVERNLGAFLSAVLRDDAAHKLLGAGVHLLGFCFRNGGYLLRGLRFA